MQISSVTSSQSLPLEKTATSQVPKPAVDQAVINFSADSFSSLVDEARQMPEVRGEVVDAFKARIQAGSYPSQDTISGLVNVLGGSIVRNAKSSSSS